MLSRAIQIALRFIDVLRCVIRKNGLKVWFCRFSSGNFSTKNAPGTSQAGVEKVDGIIAKSEQDRQMTSHNIAKKPNVYNWVV